MARSIHTTIFEKEPTFTHGEAVTITAVPSKTLNNWIQREVVHIGTMHRTGRRLYSLLDLIELRLVAELTDKVAMQPANAAAIAKEVRELKGRRPLTVWFEAGVPKVKLHEGTNLKPTNLSHAHVVIPLGEIFSRVTEAAFKILDMDDASEDTIGIVTGTQKDEN